MGLGVIAPKLGRCNAAAAGTFFVQEEPQTAAAAAAAAAAANNRFCPSASVHSFVDLIKNAHSSFFVTPRMRGRSGGQGPPYTRFFRDWVTLLLL